MRQALWKISVDTLPEAEEAAAELLENLSSQQAVAYADAETAISTVTVYLRRKPDVQKLHRALSDGLEQLRRCGIRVGTGKISFQRLRPENWAESWKRHFKPIEIGTALLIKPSWSRRKARKGQAAIILDPGLSFGTGHHATTSFCLEQLAANRNIREAHSFLDVGTGSGILAIAAAKLGYAPVDAFDFDPDAVRVARANARRNRVLNRIRIWRDDISKVPPTGSKKYHCICANLTSDLLLKKRDRIISWLRMGGRLVLAGILKKEFQQIQRAYERAGLRLKTRKAEGEWQSGVFVGRLQAG